MTKMYNVGVNELYITYIFIRGQLHYKTKPTGDYKKCDLAQVNNYLYRLTEKINDITDDLRLMI